MCKKDLLQLDFEGILKYFRVSLPRRCLTEEVSRGVMKLACSIKVKKLKKYEQELIDHKGKPFRSISINSSPSLSFCASFDFETASIFTLNILYCQ